MWEHKPLITMARVGWGSFSVAAPSQKSLQRSVGLLFGWVCLGFLMSAMICYSLRSDILMLLIWQRGLIQLAVHSRSANIKSIVVRTYFLLVMGLEEKILFLSHISRSLLGGIQFSLTLFCSTNLHQHIMWLYHIPTILAPKSKGNQWLWGFSPVYNSSLKNHQRIKEYPELEGTHMEHPSPTHDLKPQNHKGQRIYKTCCKLCCFKHMSMVNALLNWALTMFLVTLLSVWQQYLSLESKSFTAL